MTNAYYTQQADQIFPIFGVSSIDEAKQYTDLPVIQTAEEVYMNLATGSVGFESDWDDLSEVVQVLYDTSAERWIEA